MIRLGIPTGEELKEEVEDKLTRLLYQISALAHDGSLAYNQPLDFGLSKEQLQDKFFTYWPGSSDLNNKVIGYKAADGIKQVAAPEIDITRWYTV